MTRKEVSQNVRRNKNIRASRKILIRERKRFIDFIMDNYTEGGIVDTMDVFMFAQFPFHYYSTYSNTKPKIDFKDK